MAGLSPDLGVPKTAEFLGYVVSIYKKKKKVVLLTMVMKQLKAPGFNREKVTSGQDPSDHAV